MHQIEHRGNGHDRPATSEPTPSSLPALSVEQTHPQDLPQIGYGHSTAHHGEILQGVFEGPDGQFHRGLVTLPCHRLWSFVSFEPDPEGALVIEPPWKTKAGQAARRTLRHIGKASFGGRLSIRSNVPLCWGMGSSTSDVIAVIRAVSHAFHRRLASEMVAMLSVQAEVASDSIMFDDRAVLFAHREGVILEDLGRGLPPMEVLGFNSDPSGTGMDTLLTPPADYSDWQAEAFRPLLGLLRRAVHAQDIRLLGRIASASARLNQEFFPKPCFARVEALAEAVGAVGIQVAHTGSILGLLFDPADRGHHQRIESAQAGLEEMGFLSSWRFSTCQSEEEHEPRNGG